MLSLGKSSGRSLPMISLTLFTDGGGVRGMASLRMLKAVMAEVHPNKHPYQVFDMIGGTSTGGYAHCLL